MFRVSALGVLSQMALALRDSRELSASAMLALSRRSNAPYSCETRTFGLIEQRGGAALVAS